MTELDRLRESADIAWIIGDREGCIRLHAIVDAIEGLLIRLDRLEMLYGIVPAEQRGERHLNG